MKKNNSQKNISLIITISVAAIGLLVFALAFFNRDNVRPNGTIPVRVYYKNTATGSLDSEGRDISIQDHAAMATELLTLFQEKPKNSYLVSVVPDGLTIVGDPAIVSPTDKASSFHIEFSDEYLGMTAVEELFFRAALVWTMTELDFIANVQIFAGGQEILNSRGDPMGYLDRTQIDIRPVVSPVKKKAETVKLYFANQSGDRLLLEERTIDVNPENIPQFIVEQLVKGPETADHYPSVAPDVKVRFVTNSDGICLVDFSAEFTTKNPGNVTDIVSLYSIVNSLTELTKVKKVQFLIDSETGYWKNQLDLSKQYERNDSFIEP